MKSDIHVWCGEKDKILKTERTSFDKENKEVKRRVVLMYLKNAQCGASSKDFLNNINFTHLLKGTTNSTKKNSSQMFFELHNDTFEVVTGVIHKLFKSEKIFELSCTLDKVTIHRCSYTVLLIFVSMRVPSIVPE